MSVETVGPNDAVPLREDYDVVVVGAGGAGLTTALAAAVQGSRVIVAESAARLGGSSSVSGGQGQLLDLPDPHPGSPPVSKGDGLRLATRARVNAAGRRFVNEASHNCAVSFTEAYPATNRPRNLPAHAIGDGQYRRRYALAGAAPNDPLPTRSHRFSPCRSCLG